MRKFIPIIFSYPLSKSQQYFNHGNLGRKEWALSAVSPSSATAGLHYSLGGREREREGKVYLHIFCFCFFFWETHFLLSERNKNEHDNQNTNKSPKKSIVYVHMLRVKE